MEIDTHHISIACDDIAVDMLLAHSDLLLKRTSWVVIVVLPSLSIPGAKRIAITSSVGLLVEGP